MVISRIRCGLGNQIFQYAAGYQLAVTLGTTLKLDLAWFATRRRAFGLTHFRIGAPAASSFERHLLRKCARLGAYPMMGPLGRRFRLFCDEEHFHYQDLAPRRGEHWYLDGFWQTARYFSGVEQGLRRELRWNAQPQGRNLEFAHRIVSGASVSVHVRRGDYLTDKRFVLLELDYYRKALELVRAHSPDARCYVFSDDPEWAIRHWPQEWPATVVSHNGPDHPHEDLRLMSLCHHHIIANSSFSWWGAWLGEHPGKIVVAPQAWFAIPQHSTVDLIPRNWLRI
jgi:hypothetical protein